MALSNYFHPVVATWFGEAFETPTRAQSLAWPAISSGRNTLLLAPTGSGKTLAAFLVAIDRLMFGNAAAAVPGVKVLYISPLKALGVDVERNLRAPLAGVQAVAARQETTYRVPRIGVRSGDTPSSDRSRWNREPPDILITTPESLYLMLTSRAKEILRTVDKVIVDEIHSVVATKRGVHLFVSLERLEDLRRSEREGAGSLQRIGLSATQRPLDEVARLLGGAEVDLDPGSVPRPRPVEIIQAGRGKQLELRIEVPVEDMASLATPSGSGPAASGVTLPSIWPAIHPRLVELIRQHRSTMIFVNSRRLAERLAAAINELAESEIAQAHHGSIAKDTRVAIEDRLKRGELPAIVATSSLELGIDMGAVDLVIQVEAPPSIASGIQRIGRAGHQVGARSSGVIFPKYRGDLLACAAASERMMRGEVEETWYPRNPLDVLAQQMAAITSSGPLSIDQLYATLRRAAPFHELPRSAFENVLDLLAGRYPSDDFSELRPRVTWDRLKGMVSPRKGTQRVAVLNAGTIPDRGLYGVFLADGGGGSTRVGELDEEMVFETKPGDIFLLGASSWRVVEITYDRVLVVPAPGEPGRMPFWRGDGLGRPLEFGRAIGALTRQLLQFSRDDAMEALQQRHGLDRLAARNLVTYLHDQAAATGEAPSDKTLIVESFLDEVGDWRVAILSPFGARVHTPWAMAVGARLRAETGLEVDLVWTDDGMVFRLPESDEPPGLELLLPRSDEIEELIVRELGGTALFASRFRENAARALLLPRRYPGKRTPLWLQRRRSADLLAVASQYRNFPIMLETYRECLRDVFDLKGLQSILADVERRSIEVRSVLSRTPSPFASSVLFSYTANFLYDQDTPLAERRAQSLALDYAQLRELLGDAELRELLDKEAIEEVALELQRLDPRYAVKDADGLHELLQRIGDLSRVEIEARVVTGAAWETWLEELQAARRVVEARLSGERRFLAAEDVARYRDALGIVPPPGLPAAFLESVADPLGDLVSRYARTHIPFSIDDLARRFGLGTAIVHGALERLAGRGRVLEGEFLPGGRGREWCDAEVLRTLKRRSLARLRKQVEAVDPIAMARFLPRWQGLVSPRRGLDALLDAVQQLQGLPLPASTLELDILPRRVLGYRPSDLDELCAAGEVVWRGFESLGPHDGRVALYLTDQFTLLAPPATAIDAELSNQVRTLLAERGALFFEDLVRLLGQFRHDVLRSLWELVWAGEVTNDTLAPLRSLASEPGREKNRATRGRRAFRSRRVSRLPGSEGRWSLLVQPGASQPTPTERQTALARQLVERYGVLTRDLVAAENTPGGFSGLYPILKALEEAGRVRRGYFIAGSGGAQFAAPGADDRLRDAARVDDRAPELLVLAATDPANAYGAALAWPEISDPGQRPQRAAGARVIVKDGQLIAYLGRTGQSLVTFLPESAPNPAALRQELARALAREASPGRSIVLNRINGEAPSTSALASDLVQAGFIPTSRGLIHRGSTA